MLDMHSYIEIILKVITNWQVIAAVILAIIFAFAASYLGDLYHVYNPRPKKVKAKKAQAAAPAEGAEASAGTAAAPGEEGAPGAGEPAGNAAAKK